MAVPSKFEERYLLIPKILYFFVNMQYYTLHQFRSMFAMEKFNVSKSEYGQSTGVIMFITFFTNIIIGGISDRTRRPRGVLLLLTLLTVGIFLTFYIPGFQSAPRFLFWMMIFLYLTFNNPKQPLLDKIILDYLGSISMDVKAYGKQRAWGTVAYSAATYVAEWCMTLSGEKDSSGKLKLDFDNLIYYCIATAAISVLALTFLLPSGQPEEEPQQEPTQAPASRNQLSDYSALLKNKEYLFFLGIIFSNAVTRSAMTNFLTSFHRDVLKIKPYALPKSWPSWLASLVGAINDKTVTALTFSGTAFEIIVMLVSEPILSKLGFFWPLLIAQVFSLVRFFAYYSIPADAPHAFGLSCVFEFIKGIYFGLAHISAVQIATRLAPPDLRATSQMIYQGTFNALGALVGGFLFGKIFENAKGNDEEAAFRRLFMLNALICFLTIILYIYKYGIKDRILFSRQAEEAKLNAATEATAVC